MDATEIIRAISNQVSQLTQQARSIVEFSELWNQKFTPGWRLNFLSSNNPILIITDAPVEWDIFLVPDSEEYNQIQALNCMTLESVVLPESEFDWIKINLNSDFDWFESRLSYSNPRLLSAQPARLIDKIDIVLEYILWSSEQ